MSFQDPDSSKNQDVVPFNRVQFLAEYDERNHIEEYCNDRAKNDANAKSKVKQQKQFQHHGPTKENTKYEDHIGKRVIVTEYDICGTLRYLGHPVAGCVLLCGIETVIYSLFFVKFLRVLFFVH